MKRHDFLRGLHQVTANRTYLEIGVNDGRSLRLSRVPSVAVDPAFKVTCELRCDVHLVKATSDDFFARRDPLAHLRGGRHPLRNLARGRHPLGHWRRPVLDLAFIDGMHLFEYALRDFTHVERHADWSSVIVFDDMLPRNVDEAARDRHTTAWTGDVYKLAAILARHRPDLVTVLVDTQPTGQLLVFGADPRNPVLRRAYGEIVTAHDTPDPQPVPDAVLKRVGAVRPEDLLRAGFWRPLVRARDHGLSRARGWEPLRRALRPFAAHA
ncbi:class I SAM-dependent methyltransferase [Streptomyces sp. NPDC058417]|uniref:class I SAM-dependent methyltransferase n=1 Tax=unclassified Streptomyces TaxID=2593676 RepID=UPI00364B3257